MINNRMQEIMEAYSELKEFDKYSLDMESLGENGDVAVKLHKPGVTFEKTIHFKDDLLWIPDTFGYANTFTPRSRDFASESVRMAYFNLYGDLMVEHSDETMEEFRVKPDQMDAVVEKLKKNLGKKIKL